jgi:hypothetical protein
VATAARRVVGEPPDAGVKVTVIVGVSSRRRSGVSVRVNARRPDRGTFMAEGVSASRLFR